MAGRIWNLHCALDDFVLLGSCMAFVGPGEPVPTRGQDVVPARFAAIRAAYDAILEAESDAEGRFTRTPVPVNDAFSPTTQADSHRTAIPGANQHEDVASADDPWIREQQLENLAEERGYVVTKSRPVSDFMSVGEWFVFDLADNTFVNPGAE